MLTKRSVPTRLLGTFGYLVVFVFLLVVSSLPAALLLMVVFGDTDAAPAGALPLLVLGFWMLGLKLLWPEFVARRFEGRAMASGEPYPELEAKIQGMLAEVLG